MTVFDSGTIAIPGMDISDAVPAGSVNTITTEAWADNAAVAIDPATGLWRLGGQGPVVANGAKLTSAGTASVKILPFIQMGLLGANTSNQNTALNYTISGSALTWAVSNNGAGHAWPVAVRKKTGETWSVGNSLWRQDDPLSSDFGLHSVVFSATSSLAGSVASTAAASDTSGELSVDLLLQEPWIASLSSGGYAPDLVRVTKPAGETWSSGGTIYTNGVTYSSITKAGWTKAGYTPHSYASALTTATLNRRWDAVSGLAAHLHRMRLGTWILVPQNTIHRVFWQENQYDAGGGVLTADTYWLNFRTYVLVQPVTMLTPNVSQATSLNPSFPGISIDLPTAPFTSGTWNMPTGQAVIWSYGNTGATGTGQPIYGMMYTKDTTSGTVTAQRVPRSRTIIGGMSFPCTDHVGYTSHYEGDYSSGKYNNQTRRGTPRRIYVYFQGNPTSTTPEFNLEELAPDQTVAGSTKTKWVAVTGWTSASSIPLTGGTLFFGTTILAGANYKLCRDLRMSVRFTTSGVVSTTTGLSPELWRIDNLGTLPFEYDIPRWNALIQPAGTPLTTIPYVGAALSPPVSDALTWSGGYTVTTSLVSGAYRLTIVSNRASTIGASDAEKYTKSTIWLVEAIAPDNGAFAVPFSGSRSRQPQRLNLSLGSTTLDTWNDFKSFTSTSVSLGNPTSAPITYTVIIIGITSCKTIWRESITASGISNWVRSVDRFAVTVTIPPT